MNGPELRRLDAGGYVCDSDPGEKSYGPDGGQRISVSDLDASILSALAWGKKVCEIGTGLGVSTRALARTAKFVATVDPDEWVHANVVPHLPENVRAWRGVERLVSGSFGLVFVDGNHSVEATEADIHTAWNLLRRGGLLVMHDVVYDSVKLGIERAGKGEPLVIATTAGIGMWVL